MMADVTNRLQIATASLALAGLFLAGCGGGASTPASAGDDGPTRTALLRPPGLPGGGSSSTPPQAFDDAGEAVAMAPADADAGAAQIQVPAGAKYTIYCRDFTGPNHAATAERVKQQAEQVGKLGDFYLVRGSDRTVLYHGFYRTFDPAVDTGEARRAKADRDRIESLADAAGSRVFARAIFQPLEAPTPTAPPEWDLRNARGFWTLIICTYVDPAGGKQAAVESVREARKMGVEAYYLHKDGQSHVCVGTWPATAVKAQEFDGNQEENSVSDLLDPEPIIVTTGRLDPSFKELRDDRGRPYKLYEMRVEIEDATLEKAMADYEYTVNGNRMNATPIPPLLLEMSKATGREPAIDAQPTDGGGRREGGADPLLRRF